MSDAGSTGHESRLVIGEWSDASLTDKLLIPLRRPPKWFGLLLLVSGLGTLGFLSAVFYTFYAGIGVWGNNIPVAWALAITNFVWWIGIGHAGTFISAILYLLEQPWRTSLNRIAEAMTLFAIVQAMLFPLLHLGRPWFAYWLFPYPATMKVWPQFLSVLTWDFAAVATYGLVSLMFWYQGLVPDLASARDRTQSRVGKWLYGTFALGWRGSVEHWRHHRASQLVLAGLATPLVISVHSVVSMDFATAQLTGWHSMVFPPYFVAGALYSGFAMVITLVVPLRRIYGLEAVITERHFDLLGKMTLLTGSILAYSYIVEFFVAWYSGLEFERFIFFEVQPFGMYGWLFWLMLFCNAVLPQALWFRKLRVNGLALWLISILVNVGMWVERFVIVVPPLTRDFLPSSWGDYTPSLIDGALFFGSLAFFLFLFLLLLRFVPFMPIAEAKELLHEGKTEQPE